ncbi:hypothetical protein NSQ91_23970 [Paenibacillus sp. FSL R7-0048]|uniref:hypothetical protein n=1 Tax=Paenibacillus TaxID=44249 RepID=UPI00096D71B9|nr:hypothetical protein [Paenibacillus odorifer]OMD64112.1 hypothetical protein BSK48_25270 [Paenibacillus odorifer]
MNTSLSNQQLVEIIRTIPLKSFKDHGALVAVTDIYDACAVRGFRNFDIIAAKLNKLEQEHSFLIVRGYDDLIIGVKAYH